MNEELQIRITADTSDLNKDIGKSKEEIEKFGKQSKESSQEFENAINDAKQACGNAMKVMTGAMAGAIASMTALAESTREMRTNQAKLETAFESAGASAETAAQVYDDLYRVLGDDGQATEAAAHLAKLSSNQADLAEWTDICKGVYATFGDSLPIESLTEAANETAKVGTVTGALADALNWAGVSEDEFNEKLAACNDEAEREKIIRNTLNGLYKKTATSYEKNSKAVLDANDAQNKLNKQLAATGETVEPVATGIKELGAALLKDAQKPIQDISRFLTNTVFPAIKSVYGYIKNNLPAIIALIGAAGTAYVGYQVSVLAAKAAEEGCTIAKLASAAAQKVLNAAMAANPIGLCITAVAALGAGLMLYASTVEESLPTLDSLTQEQYELMEQTHKAADAFRDQQTATQNALSAEVANTEHITNLKNELVLLAGAQGQVAEKDKARAEFILGQLNEALGTEFEMVGGVIQQYKTLKTEIDNVIASKLANSLLEAANADYVAAIQEEGAAYDAVRAAHADYMQAEAEAAAEKERLTKLIEEAEERQRTSWETSAKMMWGDRIATYQAELDALEEAVGGKKKAFEDATADYQNYQNTIITYETAQAAALQGNYDTVKDLLVQKGNAYEGFADVVDEETARALEALEEEAIQTGIKAEYMKKQFENGVEGYTKDMVDEAYEAHDRAMQAFGNAYAEAKTVGEDLGEGMANGMENKRNSLYAKAQSIISSTIAAMRKAADSHSPSKKTIAFGKDLGAGAEIGISESAKDVAKASTNLVRDSLKALEGFSANTFTHNITGKITAANPVAQKSIEAPTISNILSAIGSKIGANNTPIVIEVDGKTFATTAINTINANTKQTGKLGLLV